MLALGVKFAAAVFFLFLSGDAFYKVRKINREIEDDFLSPAVGRTMRRKAMLNGIVFLIIALLAFGSLLVRIGPLGE